MNQLLFWVEAHGLNSFLYNFIVWGLGTVAAVAYTVFAAKKYNIGTAKLLLFFTVLFAEAAVVLFFFSWTIGGIRIARVFVWEPLLIWSVTRWMKLDFNTMCDFAAPITCLQQAVAHSGCIFAGCCYGYPWKYGVYNHTLGYNTFPIQPIEALVALAIAVFIILRERKKRYVPDGLSFPLMLMLFGYSRFFLEFARDNEKLFFGISELAIWALVSGIVGTAWYVTQREMNRNRKPAHKRHR